MEYNFYCYTFDDTLPVNQTTGAAIVGVYLDEKVDYNSADGKYYIGSKKNAANKLETNLDNPVNIPVYVQAVQIDGFSTAASAFSAAFKEAPWGGALPPSSDPGTEPAEGAAVDTDNLSPLTENNGTYEIKSAADLYSFAKMVNSGNNFSGKTVKLMKDIALSKSQSWTPIGSANDSSKNFAGTFDGNNNTIYYMNIVNNSAETYDASHAGLFGKLNGTVKKLNIANANFVINAKKGNFSVGFIAGTLNTSAKIESCNVSKCALTCVSKCSTYSPVLYIGGIVGYIPMSSTDINSTKLQVYGCKVSECTISGTGSKDTGNGCQTMVGGIAGIVDGCNALENCTVSNCSEIRGSGNPVSCEIGGIIGSVYNTPDIGLPVSLKNCKLEGVCNIYGTRADITGLIAGKVHGTDKLTYTNNTTSGTIKVYIDGSDTPITNPSAYN